MGETIKHTQQETCRESTGAGHGQILGWSGEGKRKIKTNKNKITFEIRKHNIRILFETLKKVFKMLND